MTAAQRADVEQAVAEYPQMVLRTAHPGIWLTGPITPIVGLQDTALLVMSYPGDPRLPIKAWAWWEPGIWVGPRHTNYGDGSICAYETTDSTWIRGKPLIELVDLVTCWLVRHMHLRYFGFWPGRQILHTTLERLRDQLPGERCGCGSDRAYAECHRQLDLTVKPVHAWQEFHAHFSNPTRRPPADFAEMTAVAGRPWMVSAS